MNVQNNIEQGYLKQSDREHRRALGQVFTPSPIADFMADWLCQNQIQKILDPAFGTGALARAVWRRKPKVQIAGYEIDPEMFRYAQSQNYANLDLIMGNYLKQSRVLADGFIANPPYIRHRNLEDMCDIRAKISIGAGYEIPKSANLYIYFCTKLIADMSPRNRGALIIPSEWMNANFSFGFKKFLKESNCLREIVAVSNCSNIFDGALTTASILLLEKPA